MNIVHTHRSVETARTTLASRRAGSALVLSVVPGTRRSGAISRPLLALLGIDLDLTGRPRNDTDDLRCCATWLAAHGITDVVLVDADRAPLRVLGTIEKAAAFAGAQTWLVLRGAAPDALQRWGRRHGATERPFRELEALLATSADEEEPAHIASVPDAAFLQLLSSSRAALQPRAAAAVRELFTSTARRAQRWARDRDVEEDATVAFLLDALSSGRNLAEQRVIAAATQLGLLHAGYLLHVDLVELLRANEHEVEPLGQLTCIREPWRAAAALLSYLEFDVDQIRALDLTALRPDGAAVCHPVHGWLGVPLAAQVAIRALLADSRWRACGDAGKPFAHLRPRAVRDAVLAAGRDVGVLAPSPVVSRRNPWRASWRQRRGVSVQRLDAA